MRLVRRTAVVLTAASSVLLAVSAGPAIGHPGAAGPPSTDDVEFEEIVFVDPAQPFHGGPPPHTATDAATDFRTTMGGIAWPGGVTVKYSVSDVGCTDDCGSAVAAVNAGFDAWEVSGVTFTQDNGSPDANPCTDGGVNSVTWTAIDGPGGTLAQVFVCRSMITKEISGFRMQFDSGDTWSDSGDADKFDIQAVSAHEAGHVVGLDHVNAPRALRLTMFRSGAIADMGPRTLGCGDRLGVNALYSTTLTCAGLPND